MSRNAAKTAESAPESAQPPEPVVADQPNKADGGRDLQVLAAVPEDGEVTFTRPGVEAKTFKVKDGKVRANEDDAAWLIQNSVAREIEPE